MALFGQIQETRLRPEQVAGIPEKIDRAFAQFERGEYFSPEQSKAEMERRKAEWKPSLKS